LGVLIDAFVVLCDLGIRERILLIETVFRRRGSVRLQQLWSLVIFGVNGNDCRIQCFGDGVCRIARLGLGKGLEESHGVVLGWRVANLQGVLVCVVYIALQDTTGLFVTMVQYILATSLRTRTDKTSEVWCWDPEAYAFAVVKECMHLGKPDAVWYSRHAINGIIFGTTATSSSMLIIRIGRCCRPLVVVSPRSCVITMIYCDLSRDGGVERRV
jgi:hypothetical protein